MENMVLGAAFGKVFSELYETVKDVVMKNLEFDAILDRLKSTLEVLEPLIKDIQRANRELDRPEEEISSGLIEKMKKGASQVKEYSKLPRWKFISRFMYANELCKLEKDLIRFFQLEAQVMNWRNVLQILLGMKISRGWSSCAVPGHQRDFIVGFEVPLKELKMHLLKEELNMLVVTGPPGCGKTTLVKMLRDDEQIKGIYKDMSFVPISRNPNLQVIVEKLFHKATNQVPEFVSDEDAIDQLEQLLNQINGHVLLILDDAWSGSESLLEKFIKISKMPNCKILVTSRTAFTRLTLHTN